MSATATLERNNETGLSNSTVSSSTSSSAERYSLDEFDTKPILLYKYRGQLQTSSQKDLCAWLDKGKLLSSSSSSSSSLLPTCFARCIPAQRSEPNTTSFDRRETPLHEKTPPAGDVLPGHQTPRPIPPGRERNLLPLPQLRLLARRYQSALVTLLESDVPGELRRIVYRFPGE
ncbi:hypothetical protein D0863_15902 [Hortaea werneckii]|uniref:Uncharacterized protein n=1 Tax=Hortaea werneckii TaxID=91943 RepID=A0A3M7C309_HORWE|nr:hypothetical protein D0863_15902 [Hortaea werneckii]